MMVHIQIDPHSGIPVYRQVMDQIKYYITSGVLKANEKLPSIRVLSRALAVNPSTIIKAYTELQHAEVIDMLQGKGAFVASHPKGVTSSERDKILKRLVRQLVVEARQMGVSSKEILQIVQKELQEEGKER